ncbi:MAG: LUD domain-containing protein [Conexivisphaerales archaeon]
MKRSFIEVKKAMYSALEDTYMRTGVGRGMENYAEKYEGIFSREDVQQLKREVSELRRHVLKNIEQLYKQAIESLTKNGVYAYYAKTRQDALSILDKIIQPHELVVKSKSLVGEEIGVRDFLRLRGNEVWETDLGEFIIQLKNEKPAQMVAPALHVPREEVAALFEKQFNKKFSPDDLEGMVATARNFLRDKIARADTGITGANAISAREGTVVTVENEGNIRLTMTMPRKHVVLSSVEKVYPNTVDCVKAALTQSYFAGYDKPTYVSLTSTPSGTGDIEKVMVRPAQGSKEMYVILLDNGRLDAASSFLSDGLRCIKCGACQLVCPVFSVDGPAWGGDTYTAAIGIVWTAIVEGVDSAKPLSYFCLSCNACNEVCPADIDISGTIRLLKSSKVK